MIPCTCAVWAIFANGTRVPVAAWNNQGKALIPTPAGDLIMAAKAPRFLHIEIEEN